MEKLKQHLPYILTIIIFLLTISFLIIFQNTKISHSKDLTDKEISHSKDLTDKEISHLKKENETLQTKIKDIETKLQESEQNFSNGATTLMMAINKTAQKIDDLEKKSVIPETPKATNETKPTE